MLLYFGLGCYQEENWMKDTKGSLWDISVLFVKDSFVKNDLEN